MKPISKLALVIASSWLCANAFAAVPNNDDPRTFLGPTLRLGTTNAVSNDMAYSLLGEAGIKNFRVGGTLGWNLDCNQRLKVSAEYLWQKITYAFFSGNADRWVHQGALGAAYQYDFSEFNYRPQFDLSAYIAHAASKSLSTVTGTFETTGGTVSYTDVRRIAGSNSAGISPGIGIMPWDGGRLSLALNYDNVRYDTRGVNQDSKGLGGTIGLNQALAADMGLGLSAGFRKPFNTYSANLSWNNLPYFGQWTMGLFGDYTSGKDALPDTYNIGLSANYMMDYVAPAVAPMSYKGDNVMHSNAVAVRAGTPSLIAWTADPAVYMPQVLAKVDKMCAGSPVSFVTPFASIPTNVASGTVELSGHFSGSNLTFTAASDTPAITVSVNGTVLSYSNPQNTAGVILVTATNGCTTATGPIPVVVPPGSK